MRRFRRNASLAGRPRTAPVQQADASRTTASADDLASPAENSGGVRTVSTDAPAAPTASTPPAPGSAAAAAPARPARKPAGTLYRGREGMWSWVAHRITGVLTFFFLFAHVLDTALVRVSPESYDKVIDTYKNPFVNLMEIGLVGAVLFHALNGLRIMAIDFWSKGPRLQRQMLWAIVIVWVVVMVPGAFFMFQHSFELLFGSN